MNIWIGLGSIDRVTTGSILWTTFLSWSRKPLIVHILLHIFQLFCIFTCLYEFYRVISSPLLLSLCNKALLLRAVLKRVPTFEGTFLTLWVPIYFSCHKQWLWKGPQLRTWSSWGPNCWNGPHLVLILHKGPHFPHVPHMCYIYAISRDLKVLLCH